MDSATVDAAVVCDVSGFAVTTSEVLPDDANSIISLRAMNGTASAVVEAFFDLGAVEGPQSVTLTDENYATCAYCVVIDRGSTYFLAVSGTLEFEALTRRTMTGTLSDVRLIEVTLVDGMSEPVPGGEMWCIDSIAFAGTATCTTTCP